MSDPKISLSALRAFPTHENHGEPGWLTVHESCWKALLTIADAAMELRAAENATMRSTGRQTRKERDAKMLRLQHADNAYRAALSLVEK